MSYFSPTTHHPASVGVDLEDEEASKTDGKEKDADKPREKPALGRIFEGLVDLHVQVLERAEGEMKADLGKAMADSSSARIKVLKDECPDLDFMCDSDSEQAGKGERDGGSVGKGTGKGDGKRKGKEVEEDGRGGERQRQRENHNSSTKGSQKRRKRNGFAYREGRVGMLRF